MCCRFSRDSLNSHTNTHMEKRVWAMNIGWVLINTKCLKFCQTAAAAFDGNNSETFAQQSVCFVSATINSKRKVCWTFRNENEKLTKSWINFCENCGRAVNKTLMVMAVIGGHLAHPTPLQNSYCNGLVQPSLIMNHHIDCQEDVHPILATNISKLKKVRLKLKLVQAWGFSEEYSSRRLLLSDLWHCKNCADRKCVAVFQKLKCH